MKKVLLSLSLLALAGGMSVLSSCDKIKDKVAEQLKYDLVFQTAEIEVTIPATNTTGSYVDMGTISQPLNIDQYIKDNTGNQLGIDNIKSAKIKSCTMTISEGADADNNFQNFVMAGTVFNTNPANSNEPVEMILDNNPDTYSTSLTLPVNTTKDMLPYIKAATLDYIIGGNLRKVLTHSVKVKIKMSFDINVQGE